MQSKCFKRELKIPFTSTGNYGITICEGKMKLKK